MWKLCLQCVMAVLCNTISYSVNADFYLSHSQTTSLVMLFFFHTKKLHDMEFNNTILPMLFLSFSSPSYYITIHFNQTSPHTDPQILNLPSLLFSSYSNLLPSLYNDKPTQKPAASCSDSSATFSADSVDIFFIVRQTLE